MKFQKETIVIESGIEDKEFEYDEVRGAHGRKPKMAILNKTKLSKYEMDDLFLGEEPVEKVAEEF